MSFHEEIKVPGSATSRKWIVVSGLVIGATWVIVGIPVILGINSGNLTEEVLGQYTVGLGEGFLPLQLISYSFLHNHFVLLLLDLIFLAGFVRFASRCLSLEGFIRIYSLGILGGGLVYLGIVKWMGFTEVDNFMGGGLGLTAMLGVLLVLKPDEETRFFGDGVAEFINDNIEYPCCIAVLFFPFLLFMPLRLWQFVLYVALFWSFASGIAIGSNPEDLHTVLPFLCLWIAPFLAGVLYGSVERLVEKYTSSMKKP